MNASAAVHHTSGGGFGRFLSVLLLISFAIIATLIVIEKTSDHAELKHGVDAVLVENGCRQNGVQQYWVEPDKKTVHQLCQLGDGRYGDWIVVKEGKRIIEKTRFVPKAGEWNKIIEWLSRKGATRINKPW